MNSSRDGGSYNAPNRFNAFSAFKDRFEHKTVFSLRLDVLYFRRDRKSSLFSNTVVFPSWSRGFESRLPFHRISHLQPVRVGNEKHKRGLYRQPRAKMDPSASHWNERCSLPGRLVLCSAGVLHSYSRSRLNRCNTFVNIPSRRFTLRFTRTQFPLVLRTHWTNIAALVPRDSTNHGSVAVPMRISSFLRSALRSRK